MTDGSTLRLARTTDLGAINDIYNHYVVHSSCTYQTEPETPEARAAWFAAHGPKHPITVAESGGEILGWGSISPFHRRAAYGNTVEDSIYIRHDQRGRGLGKLLLTDLIVRARTIGHHTIIGLIDSGQPASIALHNRLGFKEAGHLREVGHKFEQWLDVVYVQLILA